MEIPGYDNWKLMSPEDEAARFFDREETIEGVECWECSQIFPEDEITYLKNDDEEGDDGELAYCPSCKKEAMETWPELVKVEL